MEWDSKQNALQFEDRQLRPMEPDWFKEALQKYISATGTFEPQHFGMKKEQKTPKSKQKKNVQHSEYHKSHEKKKEEEMKKEEEVKIEEKVKIEESDEKVDSL